MKTYKSGIRVDHIVSRAIFVEWRSPSARQHALQKLNSRPFIQEASINEASGFLDLEYDAGQQNLRDLEVLIQTLGGEIPHTWRQRITDMWHTLQDKNRGMSEKLDPDQQIHCHTVHQKPAKRPTGWRDWPGD